MANIVFMQVANNALNFAVVQCQALGQPRRANKVDEQGKSTQSKPVVFMQLFLILFVYYLGAWKSLLCSFSWKGGSIP